MVFQRKHVRLLFFPLSLISVSGCGEPKVKEESTPTVNTQLNPDSGNPATPIAVPPYTVSKQHEDGSVEVVYRVDLLTEEVRTKTVKRPDGIEEEVQYTVRVPHTVERTSLVPPGTDIPEYLSKVLRGTVSELKDVEDFDSSSADRSSAPIPAPIP